MKKVMDTRICEEKVTKRSKEYTDTDAVVVVFGDEEGGTAVASLWCLRVGVLPCQWRGEMCSREGNSYYTIIVWSMSNI